MKHKHFSGSGLEQGAVSIFAVIFSMLLITVVTVSFVTLMIRDHQQASAADLSQSAYDSALAGVEDAKRLLVYCGQVANATTGPCVDLANKTCAESLAAVRSGSSVGSDSENIVQSGAANSQMNQAYTCLKIDPNPIDYKGRLDKDETKVIALKAKDGQNAPAEITIEWMTRDDIGGEELKVPSLSSYKSWSSQDGGLASLGDWSAAKWPAALLVQRITNTASDPLVGTTDTNASWDGHLTLANDNTELLILPARAVGNTTSEKAFPVDRVRPYNSQSGNFALDMDIYGFAGCQPSGVSPAPKYHCSIKLRFSTPSAVTLFKITSAYRGSSYRITMKDQNGADLNFSGVQASVDSTGRSADVFRRVEARVDVSSAAAPYPDAAVETKSDLCKNYFITSDPSGYGTGKCSSPTTP